MKTRVRHLGRDDRGIGLPELIISMVLLAILMTIVVSAITAFTRTFTHERASSDSASVGATGMNEVTRVVRSGTENRFPAATTSDPVFVAAASESVTLYAYLDTNAVTPAPVKVQFAIDPVSRDLSETRWAATASTTDPGTFTFSTTPLWTRVVARKILAAGTTLPDGSSAQPLFEYYTADGLVVPVDAANGVSASNLRGIAAVEVSMTVQADESGRADPVVINNRVGIPNRGVSRVGI